MGARVPGFAMQARPTKPESETASTSRYEQGQRIRVRHDIHIEIRRTSREREKLDSDLVGLA